MRAIYSIQASRLTSDSFEFIDVIAVVLLQHVKILTLPFGAHFQDSEIFNRISAGHHV